MRRTGRIVMVGGVVALVAACSSSREARPITPRTPPPESSTVPVTSASPGSGTTTPGTALPGTATTIASADTSPGSAPSSSPASTSAATSTTVGEQTITITAVAGSTGPVQTGGPPFPDADPFTEAIRLRDGTCTGWAGSRVGTTAGLEVGAPVLILEAEANEELGRGRVESSRWEDVSRGSRQWTCFFEITATVNRTPEEFRIRVAGLQPWFTGPDPTAPGTYAASVSTGASIDLIRSCPPVPDPDARRPTRTTRPAGQTSRWRAIGRYWSDGLDSLCRAGFVVTAIARPCRPPRAGSEYITEVVDSNDPTEFFRDGQRARRGTQVTVVVATGRPC